MGIWNECAYQTHIALKMKKENTAIDNIAVIITRFPNVPRGKSVDGVVVVCDGKSQQCFMFLK